MATVLSAFTLSKALLLTYLNRLVMHTFCMGKLASEMSATAPLLVLLVGRWSVTFRFIPAPFLSLPPSPPPSPPSPPSAEDASAPFSPPSSYIGIRDSHTTSSRYLSTPVSGFSLIANQHGLINICLKPGPPRRTISRSLITFGEHR